MEENLLELVDDIFRESSGDEEEFWGFEENEGGVNSDIEVEEYWSDESDGDEREEVEEETDGEEGNDVEREITPWTTHLTEVEILPFDEETAGPVNILDAEKEERDFFDLAFPPEIYQIKARETNRYARQKIAERQRPDKAWRETNAEEIRYFKTKLQTRPDFQVSFQNYFSVAAMVPNVLMMLLNIFCLQRFNRVYRMGIALVCMIAIFTLTTILVILDTEEWTGTFFGVTLASVVLINMSSAILQGGIFGFAGMLPPRYTQAVMGGQGLSGLFAAVASILSQLGQNNVIKSAFGYFFTASTVLFVCLAALIGVFRLEFVKHHTTARKYKCSCKCDSLVHDHLPEFINEDADEKMQVNIKQKSSKNSAPYFVIFRKIFPMAFAVTITFLVTLASFPSITARILSVSKKKTSWTKFFVSVTCFLFFNLGDYVGRSLAGVIQIPKKRWPKWILPMISVARIAFIPLFIFCNAQPRTVPVFFNHDVFPVVFMLLFAMSNGYFGSLAMMYGPSAVDGDHAELAGTIMACCLSIGLGLGAASSFLVTSFI